MVTFMSSTAGRWTRAIVGVALIGTGAILGGAGWALAAVGVVFVAVGAGDVCLLAPLFGKPLKGREVRAAA
ncbi:YgaP-like transmembrane domain [Demequina sp. NBRC 110054]|uniref:YgaP-like transmembrane domain n=1 Tax=Demequina sp. NBRC 110054 TaxID=1570343 RepID=UPI000A05B777|nr:YgaP-like transmembrane domain [Demequina sp. NBRC 110054]